MVIVLLYFMCLATTTTGYRCKNKAASYGGGYCTRHYNQLQRGELYNYRPKRKYARRGTGQKRGVSYGYTLSYVSRGWGTERIDKVTKSKSAMETERKHWKKRNPDVTFRIVKATKKEKVRYDYAKSFARRHGRF